MQLGIAIGIQRPLAVALTIFGHAEPEPPAALIRLLAQQFHVKIRRLGMLTQLLAEPGPGGVIIQIAGQIRSMAGQPAERLELIATADGEPRQQQPEIGLFGIESEPLFQQLARFAQPPLAVQQARQLLARP